MVHILLATATLSFAVQGEPAAVMGTVRDAATGAALHGAVVTLSDRATATGVEGRYVLNDVPPGLHPITVRLMGYATHSLRALVPPTGRVEINVTLRVEPVPLPTMHILGFRQAVGPRGVFPERELSIEAVRVHPLLAEPDAFQALGGGEVALGAEAPSGMHIRGGAADQTAYAIDGFPVLAPYHAAGVVSAWNPDALAGLRIASTAPTPAGAHALSGTVMGTTRAPGVRHGMHATASSTQARVTVDGPLPAGAGYLLSWRSAFPGFPAPAPEASYVRGEMGDWLAKIEAPALAGRLRLFGYESADELTTAALADTPEAVDPGRNAFEWSSRSLGAEWQKVFPAATVRIAAWSAVANAEVEWQAPNLRAGRRDIGVVAEMDRGLGAGWGTVGARVERVRTTYSLGRSAGELSPAQVAIATGFARYARPIGARTDFELAASVAATPRGVYPAPAAQARWRVSDHMALAVSYARRYQFAQSLRNSSSIVGTVFPVELYAAADGADVPVARSDQIIAAADYEAPSGVHVRAQVWRRALGNVLVVAPLNADPFVTGGFEVGSATAFGASGDFAASIDRHVFVASYGLQRVRQGFGRARYAPDHAVTHRLAGGMTLLPVADMSLRLGVVSSFGRRATPVAGSIEWEACNLGDRGCEFAGTPITIPDQQGGVRLPAYLRIDLGARKQWTLSVGGRRASVALFGTLTNVLGRENVLTYALDLHTNAADPVTMRPLAPLVVGLDWRY